MNDLNDLLQLRSIELADGVAEILLLLEREDIVVCNRLLPLLAFRRRSSLSLLRRGLRCRWDRGSGLLAFLLLFLLLLSLALSFTLFLLLSLSPSSTLTVPFIIIVVIRVFFRLVR